MYAKIFTAKIQEQLILSWRWKFFYLLSSFIYHVTKNHEIPCKIIYVNGLFVYLQYLYCAVKNANISR